MTIRLSTSFWVGVTLIMLVVNLPEYSQSSVEGRCDNCHTMHNSQSGSPVVASGPLEVLLNQSCISCHTGTNTGIANLTPYVYDTAAGAPIYPEADAGTTGNTLAGGNFYWVNDIGEGTGHNVHGISGTDSRFGITPPGQTSALGAQLECAGANGCHGALGETIPIRSMKETHHHNVKTEWKDGTAVAKSYRFLSGIQGFGDSRYEYQPTNLRHNKYWGKDRANETDEAILLAEDGGTISSQCARCHGDYHNGNNTIAPTPIQQTGAGNNLNPTGVWIRHPTDFDMSRSLSSSEYTNYNDPALTGTNNYSVIAPLAIGGASNRNTTLNTVIYILNDDAIVMCISCHRAHGTPYASSLRWNYRAWPTGGYDGCSICHTTKD